MSGLHQSDYLPGEVIAYLRKSRSDDPALTVQEVLARHELILDEWSEARLGARLPDSNKLREVVSGETIADRPEMKRLLSLIERPDIKAVLVVDVQRLSRGDLEDAGRLIKLLRYTGTKVLTPQKSYDLRDEYDREFFERELKRGNEYLEYQKKIMGRGRLLSVQQGNFIGSVPPYGYKKTFVTEGKRKCPTLQIDEDEAAVVRMIFDMYAHQDMGRHVIAARLDSLGIPPPKGEHWSPAALQDILQNVHYTGKVSWNRRKTVNIVEDGEIIKTRPKTPDGDFMVFQGKHEPIVSDELFAAVREKQGRHHRARVGFDVRNPFAGLLYCKCGRAMTLRFYKDKKGGERSSPRLLCLGQTRCGVSSCLFDELLERVCEVLERSISDFEIQLKNESGEPARAHQGLIKKLEARLSELYKKELSIWDKYAEEAMPKDVFDSLNKRLLNEREEVERTLRSAREAAALPQDTAERLRRLSDALAALCDPDVTALQKNRLLKECIERITYTREKSVRITKSSSGKAKLPVGCSWSSPPFEIDVQLRL